MQRWVVARQKQKMLAFPHPSVSPFLCVCFLVTWVRGRRQAHNPTLAKIMRLGYTRKRTNTLPQTSACNDVWKDSSRASMITRLGEQLPLPRQVSMKTRCGSVPS